VKKDRFGKSKGPLSKAEIEREAQRELERLSRGAGARSASFTPPSGPPTALDDVADSVRGRSAPPPRVMGSPVPDLGPGPGASQFGGVPGGRGAPPPNLGPNAPFYDDDEEAADEAANVTEIALRDHAARFGSNPEDLVIRQDPFAAEMMRDQAMRQFLDQQQAQQERPRRGPAGDPVTSVLNRLAARKKAEEEALARGDDGSGETVLDRIRARREAIQAEDEPPAPRSLRGGPARGGPDRARPRMVMIDDDEDDPEESPLAIMRARAEARRPQRPNPPSRVYAVPEADDELDNDEVTELEGDDDPFVEDDEALEPADVDDELDDDEDGVDAPPAPDFADVVARLSGGRTEKSAPEQRRTMSRRSTAAAPRKAKAPATKASPRKASASRSRTTDAPAGAASPRTTTSKRLAAKATGSGSTARVTKADAATTAGARTTSRRPSTTPGPATAMAAPADPRAKAAPARAKAAPPRAKAVPAKTKAVPAKTKAVPAKTKAVPAKTRTAPARVKAAPSTATAAKAVPSTAAPAKAAGNDTGSDAAARKAAVKAKIAAAAKQARPRR